MTTQPHLCITLDWHVIETLLPAGNISDTTVADELAADMVGCYMVEDKGYDSQEHRRTLESNNNFPVIPGFRHRKDVIAYNKTL
ncbi:MAG: transposase [Candidatus Competibacteraceae bacterium]|nr:transposase [Candidatus Competibacteraceae bacterium]